MTVQEAILDRASKLPVKEQLGLVEAIVRNVRQEDDADLERAADALFEDYKSDAELAAFTALDAEPFYEAR